MAKQTNIPERTSNQLFMILLGRSLNVEENAAEPQSGRTEFIPFAGKFTASGMNSALLLVAPRLHWGRGERMQRPDDNPPPRARVAGY